MWIKTKHSTKENRVYERLLTNRSFSIYLAPDCNPKQILSLLWDATKGWVFDTAACVAQTGDWSVVGPSSELLLHG